MKWTVRSGVAAALFGMSAAAQAGLFGGLLGGNGCCEEDCCEEGCPVVARPCEQVYTYQRKCSDLRPPCCDEDCCEEPCCDAPCCDTACGEGCGSGLCGKKGCNLLKGLFGKKKHGCLDGAACCETGCADECPTDCADPCEIAKLIYAAQTSCHAEDRAEAVDELGEFDCRCHPEIMVVLVYSLNDADEEVRAEAADAIGDLIEDGRCCCSPEVVSALTCAAGDCDEDVRDEAEDALEICGYEVVEGCCEDACCTSACGDVGGTTAPAAPAQAAPVPTSPAPAKEEAAPAPAPPADPEAYFPSRFKQQTRRPGSLTNVFGLNQ